jgi:hypothetical protein
MFHFNLRATGSGRMAAAVLFFKNSFIFFERFRVLLRINYGGLLFKVAASTYKHQNFMSHENDSTVVAEADVQAVKTAIATIKAKLLFLARLTEDEPKAKSKPGSGQLRFGQNPWPVVAKRGELGRDNLVGTESAVNADLVSLLIDLVAAMEELVSELDHARLAGTVADICKLMPAEQPMD